jgi:hypothetical protein
MIVARFYRSERMTSRRLGHAPTLGHVRIGLNMIHGPMGQNKVSLHRWQKKCVCTKMIWTLGLMHIKVDSRIFPESICMPESEFILGRGGRHKLLLFWNPNVTGANVTPFPSCPSFLSNKTEHTFPLSK